VSVSLPAALLFDMDGTLVDSEELWLEAEIRTMRALGAPWGPDDQAHCLGGPLERVAEYMVQRAGASVPSDVVGQRLLTEVLDLVRALPPLWRPGARELVEDCLAQRVPCALVSASWRSLMNAVVAAISADLGRQPFDVIIAGDEVSVSKPHPEPYLAAARHLGVEIDDCAAIEDSPTGVRSAHAAGAFTVAVPHLVPIAPDARLVVVPTLEGVTINRLALWMSEDRDRALG
jgi:HAD superfamily hydrolase (TIGR01509 family)